MFYSINHGGRKGKKDNVYIKAIFNFNFDP